MPDWAQWPSPPICPFMLTFRYGLSDSGQLIAQFARGRGGQAVIENYSHDLDTGAATGGSSRSGR